MRLDSQLLFSDNQVVTTTAASTNVVKMANTENGLKEVAFGNKIPLLVQVTEDFAGCTSVAAAVETSETEDFASATTLVQTSAIPLASLKAGYKFPIGEIPAGNKGYMRMKYSVNGTATAGKITAGIVDAIDNSYQDM